MVPHLNRAGKTDPRGTVGGFRPAPGVSGAGGASGLVFCFSQVRRVALCFVLRLCVLPFGLCVLSFGVVGASGFVLRCGWRFGLCVLAVPLRFVLRRSGAVALCPSQVQRVGFLGGPGGTAQVMSILECNFVAGAVALCPLQV